MPIYDPIPENLELARQRELKYRTRCAWGGNHLRRLDDQGNLLRQVEARNSEAGHGVDACIDGFRPHEDPLNAAYEGYWKSSDMPIKRFGGYVYDTFTDTGLTALASHTPDIDTIGKGWFDPASGFRIDAGGTQLERTGVGCDQNQCYIDVNGDEYLITFSFYVNSAVSFDAGWMVRWKDQNNWIALRLHSNSGGQVDLIKKVRGGAPAFIVNDTTYTLTTGWKTIAIAVTATTIRAWVDGVRYVDVQNDLFGQSKKIGPYCWSGCSPYWDTLVTYLDRGAYEAFDDWSSWTQATYGSVGSANRSISTEWGKHDFASGILGTRGGISERLNAAYERNTFSMMQFALGTGLPNLTGTGRFFRTGIVLATDLVADPFASTYFVAVYLESNNAGYRLITRSKDAGSGDVTYNSVAYTKHSILGKLIFDSSDVCHIFAHGSIVGGFSLNTMPHSLGDFNYMYLFTESDDTSSYNGYFRDIGYFQNWRISLKGEVGHGTDNLKLDTNAFVQSLNGEITIGSDGDGNYLGVRSTVGGNWNSVLIKDNIVDDFEWDGYGKKKSNVNYGMLFRASDTELNSCQCYGVTWEGTRTILFKDLGAGGAGRVTNLEINNSVTTAVDELFYYKIQCQGDRIRVWKNTTLVFDYYDSSYSGGYFGFQTYNNVVHHYYPWEVRPRGFQTVPRFRLDRSEIENPLFSDWLQDSGIPEAATTEVSAWYVSNVASLMQISKADGLGIDGEDAIKIYHPGSIFSSINFGLNQSGINTYKNHRYRSSFWYKLVMDDPTETMPPVRMQVTGVFGETSEIYLDTVEQDTWLQLENVATYTSNDIDMDTWFRILLFTLPAAPSSVGFTLYVTRVMRQDITDSDDTAEWTTTPVAYRSQFYDRFSRTYSGRNFQTTIEDYSRLFAYPSLTKTWKTGDETTWGLHDSDGADIFTSRPYLSVLLAQTWRIVPQWLQIDLGRSLLVNQVKYYSLWSEGARWMRLTYGDEFYVGHDVVEVMPFLPETGFNKFDLETSTEQTARYWMVVFLDSDEEGEEVTCQQIELYGFVDESDLIVHDQDGSPQVSIIQRRLNGINSLPDAAQMVVSLNNQDNRFTPRNKFSPLFQYAQLDGLGDVRSNVPVRISMFLVDTDGTIYETNMFYGTVGVDKNKGGALGITINSVTKIATLDGIDVSSSLDQPTPVDELDVWENISPEEAMLQLCYIAGIPKQDTDFDATGMTFTAVVLREQTIREQIYQIVEVLGGRFYMDSEGVFYYRNVAAPRTWTQTDRHEFDAGVKSDVDTKSVLGEVAIGNVVWPYNDNFNVLPENESDPWTIENADNYRFISGGEYFVLTPASTVTAMQHIKEKAYNKTNGFTLEFDVGIELSNPSYSPVFDIWGYTDNIVVYGDDRDYYQPYCAWRVEIYRWPQYPYVYRFRIGGLTSQYGIPEPELWTNYAGPDFERCRIRITFSGNQYTVYCNEYTIGTFTLAYPGQIRWGFYESASYYKDQFNAGVNTNLSAWTGWDANTTRSPNWVDPSNSFMVRSAGYVNLQGVDNQNSWLDFQCPEYEITIWIYLDRTIGWGTRQGMRVKQYDVNNFLRVELWSSASPYHPNMIGIYPRFVRKLNGVETYVEYGSVVWAFEGSHKLRIQCNLFGVLVFLTAYQGGPMGPEEYVLNWNSAKEGIYPVPWAGWTKFGFFADPGSPTSFDNMEVTKGINWYDPVSEDYVGKLVIGPTAPEIAVQKDPAAYIRWTGIAGWFRTAFRLNYFRQTLGGATAPLVPTAGNIISQSHDCSVNVSGWGVFEAEMVGVGGPVYSGTMFYRSRINFYIQVSTDGLTWDDWVSVVPGELISTDVALKRYVRWKAELSKDNGYYNWRTPKLRSVTVNFLVESEGENVSFRVTYDLASNTSMSIIGQELSDANYSMGNPAGNRVSALVNRWVEQAITNYTVTGIAFWESQDLPQVIDNGDIYEVNAEYSNPSKKGTGGTLRHLNVTINATPYVVNDGTIEQVCGSTKVTFLSGQRIGYIKVEATANGQSIDVLAIDAVEFLPASDLDGTERVSAEDTQMQAVARRVIESELIDNAFAMTRAIGQLLVDAKLVHDKFHRESVEGVTFPILPSLSLNRVGVVNAPDVGFYEREVTMSELTHEGFRTIIAGEGVRTEEDTAAFDPLSMNPDMMFCVFRLPTCQTTYIVQLRRGSDSTTFDVWDVRQGFTQYKTSEFGDWIEAAGDTYTVVQMYDQSGNGNHAVAAAPANEPEWLFNDVNHNAFPGIYYVNERLDVSYDISPGVHADITSFAMLFPTNAGFYAKKYYGHDNGGFDRAMGFDWRGTKNFAFFNGTGATDVDDLYSHTRYLSVHEYQTALSSVWINGDNKVNDSPVTNGAGLATMFLGQLSNLFAEPWEGGLSMFGLYPNVLTDDVRQRIEGYFNGKFDIY